MMSAKLPIRATAHNYGYVMYLNPSEYTEVTLSSNLDSFVLPLLLLFQFSLTDLQIFIE